MNEFERKWGKKAEWLIINPSIRNDLQRILDKGNPTYVSRDWELSNFDTVFGLKVAIAQTDATTLEVR